jgi:hypothetical protein
MPLFTNTQPLSSGGTATSAAYTTTTTGTDYWVATYNGDPSNSPAISGVADEPVTITSTTPLGKGDTATIGFWHNKNGQALIDALNGGGTTGLTPTALGNWLAKNFPHLYGASVDPTNPLEKNLTGVNNAGVASFFSTIFGANGLSKTYAQVMAVALATYSTNSTLAGGTYAAGYGFNVSSGGIGGETFNVGSDGMGLGLTNNTPYAIFTILTAADTLAGTGTAAFNADLSNINDLFSNINQKGDIS